MWPALLHPVTVLVVQPARVLALQHSETVEDDPRPMFGAVFTWDRWWKWSFRYRRYMAQIILSYQ